jgi:hypothetical protein
MTAQLNQASTQTIEPQARRWLRLEGFAVFVAAVAAFGQLGGEYLWLVPALLLPDLAMIGYLAGPRIGALAYNAVHNWAFGIAVGAIGIWLGAVPITLAGVILIAHTGMDRSVGYGLKFMSGFHDTHLGRVGRLPAAAPTTTTSAVSDRPATASISAR